MEDDFLFGQYGDGVVGGGEGDGLVGEEFEAVGVCVQAGRAMGGDDVEGALLAEQAEGTAAGGGKGFAGLQMGVALAEEVEGVARLGECATRSGEGDAVWGLGNEPGFGHMFDRGVAMALSGFRAQCGLTIDLGRMFAVYFGVNTLAQLGDNGGGVEGGGLMAECGLMQGSAGLLGAAPLRQGLAEIHLRGACGSLGSGGEQEAGTGTDVPPSLAV